MGRPRQLNKFTVSGDKAYFVTTNSGKVFTIDLQFVDKIIDNTWYENKQGYIYTMVTNENGIRRRIFLHRLICDVVNKDWRKFQVDHRDHNIKNNCSKNLRVCTNGENQLNKLKTRSDNTSGVIGVSYDKRWKGCWKSTINFKGERIHLGDYKNKEDAIKARKEAELMYYKDFVQRWTEND